MGRGGDGTEGERKGWEWKRRDGRGPEGTGVDGKGREGTRRVREGEGRFC